MDTVGIVRIVDMTNLVSFIVRLSGHEITKLLNIFVLNIPPKSEDKMVAIKEIPLMTPNHLSCHQLLLESIPPAAW